jgi:hypothetical protein
MTGEIEDITEWAIARYHWHQKCPEAESLRVLIHGLAERYDFTTTERMELGKALQGFASALQDPPAEPERNGPMAICCACTHGEAVQFNPPLCRHCAERSKFALVQA